MTIREIFEHRSSRVIAVARIALALLFALWVWIDPHQPVRGGLNGYLLLTAYVAYACALFPLAWGDWWLDFRLTVPAFLIDCGLFFASLYYTGGGVADIGGANYAFFTFLTLSAALRWNWRTTLAIAAMLSVLYFGLGMLLQGHGPSAAVTRYFRRSTYMVVLSLIVTWLAVQRSSPLVGKFAGFRTARARSPFESALAYAMEVTGATGAALAWENSEEPGSTLQLSGTLQGGNRHVAPGELDVAQDQHAMLFDRERRRQLKLGTGDGLVVESNASGPELAAYLGLNAGLSVPIDGTTGQGQIVLVGIAGLCRDHLALGQAVAREIAHGLDEEEISSLARETAVVRLRGNIARDLHDSVAQSLAGAAYRVASLRQQLQAGKDILPEIDAISEGLHAEQAHIREIIARLRSDAVNPGMRNLGTEIDRLAGVLGRQWQVEVTFDDSTEPQVLPAWLVFEIQQLVREGVANAVRHGAARHITVRTGKAAGGLSLAIADDGSGFPDGAGEPRPQSLTERVAALGGKMDVISDGGETRIGITVPLGGRL